MPLSPEQRQTVKDEAISWLNTKYHPLGRLKGIGVDCAMLIAEVYERAGVIEHCDPGFYSANLAIHSHDDVFERFIRECGGVQTEAPDVGDVVMWRFGKSFSHGGILVTENRFVHAALAPGIVCYGDLTDADVAWRKRRFYEMGG